jgi:hypothetical protein
MADLKSPRLMYAKAGLLVVAGLMAIAGILIEVPSWRVAALLAIVVWAFCRVYYFMFYVIERWIGPRFRFAGVWGAVAYMWKQRRAHPEPTAASSCQDGMDRPT